MVEHRLDGRLVHGIALIAAMLSAVGVRAGTNTNDSARAATGTQSAIPYRCELESTEVSVNVSRTIRYSSKAKTSDEDGARDSVQLTIKMLLFGPEGRKYIRHRFDRMIDVGKVDIGLDRWDYSETPRPKLEKVVDDTGKDLIGQSTVLMWESNDDEFAKFRHEKPPPNQLGTISLSNLEAPADAARKLVLLKGTMYLAEITEEEKVEIKPLSAHLKKPVTLPDGTAVTIELLAPSSIFYTISWKAKDSKGAKGTLSRKALKNMDRYQFKFFSAEGKELQTGGGGSHGGSEEMKCEVTLIGERHLEEGAYAVIQFPKKTQVVEIPFEFKDVQLPETSGLPKSGSPSSGKDQ